MYGTYPALVRLPFSIHLIVEVALEADLLQIQGRHVGVSIHLIVEVALEDAPAADQAIGLVMFQSTLSWK